jgi:glycosyltransferase involved in cell wall biosynthesis
MRLFAKTRWLVDTIRERHGVAVTKVEPGLDTRIFHPVGDGAGGDADDAVRIAAMIRPHSPHRGPGRTLAVLAALRGEPGPPVEIHLFGAAEDEIRGGPGGELAAGTFHGVLTAPEVAALLARTDVFVDLSDYQAFGRTGLEAMACGCVPVLPIAGGAGEFATHGEDALLVDTGSTDACLAAIRELQGDPSLRRRLRRAGILRAMELSLERAVASELDAIRDPLG